MTTGNQDPSFERIHPDDAVGCAAAEAAYVAWLLNEAGNYLHRRGEPGTALPSFQRAYELSCRVLGDDHPNTLTATTDLAADPRALGQYEAARQFDEDTLTRARRVLGQDHPVTFRSVTNLALDLRGLGSMTRPSSSRKTSAPAAVPLSTDRS
jgi:hypothetical protein